MRHHHRRHHSLTLDHTFDHFYGRRGVRTVKEGRTRNWSITKRHLLSSDSETLNTPRLLDLSDRVRPRLDPSDTVDILVGSGIPDARRIPEEFKRVRVVSTLPSIKVAPVPSNTHNRDVLGVGAHVVETSARSLAPAFRIPASVLICSRRKQRRSVLFAFGRTGRGHKRPRWKQSSYIRC